MKKFFISLLAFILSAALLLVVLNFTGILPFNTLLGVLRGEQPPNYLEPDGEGSLHRGDLPEDQVPDAESLYQFSAELHPYWAMLNPSEQGLYAQVYGNALGMHGQFPVHTPVQPESVKRAMTAVFCDQPALFWMNTSYKYSYTEDQNVVAVTLSYNEASKNYDVSKKKFDDATRAILSGASQFATAVEKEKYVYEYLIDNVSYSEGASLNQSAYSALVNGKTVCAGYARAFQHIMQQLEIPCYFCTGDAGEPHAWNIVRLDGEYYNVDVTWGDTDSGSTRSYAYFNLTDAQIGQDHTREGLSTSLPTCTGTRYSYDNAFGANAAQQDDAQKQQAPPAQAPGDDAPDEDAQNEEDNAEEQTAA